jgi:hypothetical protein
MASLFSTPKVPKPPKPTPTLMPDEKTLAKAKKRSIGAQKMRSGRASTMLSDSDTLG